MPYTFPEIRSFAGLYLQQNSFQVPDGAMEVASKVVIRSDEVISKTNGLFEYWRPDGVSPLDTLSATYTYQGVLIGFFEEGIGFFTDTFPYGGTFNSVGVLTENDASDYTVSFSVSTEFMEQNQNLYMTANEGVYKLESFSDKARRAGVPPALGLDINYLRSFYTFDGILPANSQTAYRVVFGRRDLNGNLQLSAPSDVLTIGVPAKKVGAAYTVSGGIVTVTYPDNYFVQNYVYYPGTTNYRFDGVVSNATDPALNGDRPGVTAVLGTSLSFTTGAANGTGTLDLEFTYRPNLIAQIPSEITNVADEYFVQLYRSSSSLTSTTSPAPDFALINEITLTENDILAGQVYLFDDVDPQLVGALLYTNPNTREGPLQENSRPPKTDYLTLYKNYAAFANIASVQRATLNLVNPVELIGVDLIFKSGVDEEVYRAVDSSVYIAGNVSPTRANVVNQSPLEIDLFYTHDFPLGSKVQVNFQEFDGIVPGEYTVTAVTATTVTLNTVSTTFGLCNVQVVADDTARLYNGYGASGVTFSTIAEWTEYVTKDLVRAINGNAASFMYANYRSTFADFPGTFSIESKGYIDPIYVAYTATPTNPAFIQNIPSSFSTGIQFFSENDRKPHWVYFSKVSEPEAVPIINFFPVGSENSPIVDIFALKDSLIILKTDGVYKLVGDVIDQFEVTAIDKTVKFIDGMAKPGNTINNTVIAFCNQGVVQISENSVQVISRRIEDVIQPLIGRDLSDTFLVGHESDRLFYVQTEGLNSGDAQVTWIYNVLNQSWTSTTDVFVELSLGPDNALFGVRLDSTLLKNVLWRQRKTNTRVDWCNEYLIGDLTVDTSMLTGTFTITGGNDVEPGIGDVILSQNIFNRITAVVPSGGDYILTFAQMTSIPTGSPQTVTLYKAYESKIKMAPFHAGQVSRSKHYAQMQIHLRQQVLTDLTIEFAGAYFGGSEVTSWRSLNVSTAGSSGWGFSPWGLFPWGLVDGANLVSGTEPSNIIRLYVPRFAARNTFIQPILTHTQAGQPMFIQAMGWAIHGYNERTSR